jgi:hypothetical protein
MDFDLFRLIEEYGIKGFIFALLIILTTAIVKTNWFSKWWTKTVDRTIEWFMKKKVKGNLISESDIVNHDIFNYIDFWIYSKIPTFQFSTEYRTIIFRKYLTIYLRSYKKELYDFIQKGEYEDMDQSQLWKSFLDLMNKIVFSYEKEFEESGIPKIVVIKMKSKNNDAITLTIDLIEGISNSQFYEGDKNFLKIYSIMNIILSILENTISNSEMVCNSINGQLKGLSIIENDRLIVEP